MLPRIVAFIAFVLTLAGLLIAPGLLRAQSVPPTPNAVQDQIERQLGHLIIANAQCSGNVLTLQSQVATLQAELTKLKAEAKKP